MSGLPYFVIAKRGFAGVEGNSWVKNKEDEIDLDGLDFFKTMRIIRGWTILIMGVALIAFSTITFLNIL